MKSMQKQIGSNGVYKKAMYVLLDQAEEFSPAFQKEKVDLRPVLSELKLIPGDIVLDFVKAYCVQQKLAGNRKFKQFMLTLIYGQSGFNGSHTLAVVFAHAVVQEYWKEVEGTK